MQLPATWGKTAGRAPSGPGGGRRHQRLTFGTLNVQGLSDHTLRMLLADGPDEGDTRRRAVDTWLHGDVIGITELHAGEKHQRWAEESGGRFACSALPGEKDPAGGVGLILSVGAVRALKGDVQVEAGGRIIWVRFVGEFHDFFVLVVYVPHRGRTAPPFQEEVMEQVAGVLRKHSKPGDCISLMGDFNGRLGRGRGGKGARVGRFTPHPREDEGGRLLRTIMEEFELWAPRTFFFDRWRLCC